MFKIKIPRLPFREDGLFSILVLLALVVPLVFCYYTYEKFETIKISLWLLLLAWAIAVLVWQRSRTFFIYKPVLLILGLFLVFALVSTVFSVGPVNSLFGSYPRFTNGLLFYFLWALTLILLLLILDHARLRVLLKILFFDAWLVALVGILQSFGIGFYTGLQQASIDRAPSLLGNPNFSSMFIVSILPLAFPLFLQSRKLPAKIYYLGGVFLIIWATMVLSSRGAWLGLVFAAVIGFLGLLIFHFPKKYLLFVVITLTVSFLMLFGFLKLARPNVVLTTLQLSESNVNLRMFVWDIAREAIIEKPLVGVGPGNFQIYFERHRGKNLVDQGGVFDDAHNLYLQMAATTGLPFTVCFLTLLALAAYKGVKRLRQEQDLWTLGLLVGLVSWLLMASFNPVSSASFLLLAVFLAGLFSEQGKKQEVVFKRLFKVLLTILGIALALLGICFMTSEVLFFKAYKDYFANRFLSSQKYLRAALFFNPTNQMFYAYQAADGIFLNEPYSSLQNRMSRIVKLQPQDSKSYLTTAKLYFLIYDRTGDSSYLKQAIIQMDESLKMDPLFAQRYYRAGFYLTEAGDLSEGLQYVKFGLSLNPKDLPGWLLLARIYQLQGRQEQALSALEKAYKLKPEIDEIRLLWRLAKNNPKRFKELPIPAFIDIRNFD